MTFISNEDLYFFGEGRGSQAFERLGAHIIPEGGVHFAVWAPNAREVSVIGDFNGWQKDRDFLHPQGSSGIWAGVIPAARKGDVYKYFIRSHQYGAELEKADPFAFCAEAPPKTGSVVWDLDYQWHDGDWLRSRAARQRLDAPMSVYELHLGSWRQKTEEGGRPLTYREMADELVGYVSYMGFTHVELMPVMEHPYSGSWGYQLTGYFAPTRRFGDPQDFMYLVDRLHQAGIGIILDWVPSHFAVDAHGLSQFDGTALFEHADPQQGFHPDWGSFIFNYDRNEVRSFLISNAMFWLEKYHIDALRVDAVASMLYLDYSRKHGEWVANDEGGRENKGAIRFMRDLNTAVYGRFPDIQMIAEESTAWPGISRPVDHGGVGFGLKWDMGWMHDTLHYFKRDAIYRSHHQGEITFRALYMFTENFMLPLSHDEVVHGKGSLINNMPGDDWQKFANLRALYSYMYAQPGKKLLFMGSEFAQWDEWNHNHSLDWHLAGFDRHRQIQNLVRDLNAVYRAESALHVDCHASGFEWIDASDYRKSILSYLRKNPATGETIICVHNMTPMPHYMYRIGAPAGGHWREIFNSDAADYGGSDLRNGGIDACHIPHHGREFSVQLALPPLATIFLKLQT